MVTRCHGDHGYCHRQLLICTDVVDPDSSNGTTFLRTGRIAPPFSLDKVFLFLLRRGMTKITSSSNSRSRVASKIRKFCLWKEYRKGKKKEKTHNGKSVHGRLKDPLVQETTLYLAPPLASPQPPFANHRARSDPAYVR